MLRDVVNEDLPILYEIQREPEGNARAAVAPRDEAAFLLHLREKLLLNEEVKIQAVEVLPYDGTTK